MGEERTTASDWVGERIIARTNAGEDINGTLENVTDHGIIVNTTGRGKQGPSYYSWEIIIWMYPADRQTSGY